VTILAQSDIGSPLERIVRPQRTGRQRAARGADGLFGTRPETTLYESDEEPMSKKTNDAKKNCSRPIESVDASTRDEQAVYEGAHKQTKPGLHSFKHKLNLFAV